MTKAECREALRDYRLRKIRCYADMEGAWVSAVRGTEDGPKGWVNLMGPDTPRADGESDKELRARAYDAFVKFVKPNLVPREAR